MENDIKILLEKEKGIMEEEKQPIEETNEVATTQPVMETPKPALPTAEKQQKQEEQDNSQNSKHLVNDELAKARQVVSRDEKFQSSSMEVAARDMRAALNEEALAVLSAEQKNALAEYTLKKQKERLDYRIKYEKKIDREEIKAEVYARKVKNAEAMYGRYYKQEVVDTLDKDGNVVKVVRYKNFTTSKFVNRIRVFANWYNNLAEGARRVIWTTIKIFFWGGLAVGIGFGLYGIFKWLVNSGIINKITETANNVVAAAGIVSPLL